MACVPGAQICSLGLPAKTSSRLIPRARTPLPELAEIIARRTRARRVVPIDGVTQTRRADLSARLSIRIACEEQRLKAEL
jgi:hypothetical protein